MENEIWKPVVGYEGYYEVSNMGKVRSTRWRGGYKTHPVFHRERKDGYIEIQLTRNKKTVYTRVHLLVAKAFIPNPENKKCIDHIDCDRANNRVDNLRWCTYKENANNPISRKRQSEAQKEQMKIKWEKGCCESIKKPILQYSLDGEFIAEWESSAEAARSLAGDGRRLYTVAGKIAHCANKGLRQSMGYIWVRKGQEDSIPQLVEQNKTPKTIRVRVSFPDGTSKEYESVNKAAKELGIQNLTFRNTTYSKRLNISWELLNTHTCYENRWGGAREDMRGRQRKNTRMEESKLIAK